MAFALPQPVLTMVADEHQADGVATMALESRASRLCRGCQNLEIVAYQDSSGIKTDMVVWAEAQNVFHDIRTVVRLAERLHMSTLGVGALGRLDRLATNLAAVFV
jgi:hypothetical protein